MRMVGIDSARNIGATKLAMSLGTLALAAVAMPTQAAAVTCTPTGFSRDSIQSDGGFDQPAQCQRRCRRDRL